MFGRGVNKGKLADELEKLKQAVDKRAQAEALMRQQQMQSVMKQQGAGVPYGGFRMAMTKVEDGVIDYEQRPEVRLSTMRRSLDPSTALYKVADYLPIGRGVWLCGGAVRRWAEGGYSQTDGDFDLFLGSGGSAAAVALHMDKLKAKKLPSPRGTSCWELVVEGVGPVKVQSVDFKSFGNVASVLKSFDFTINQGAVVQEDGKLYTMTTKEFDLDVADRVLRPVKPRSLRSLLKRMQKFMMMGYTMPDDALVKVLEMSKRGELPHGIDQTDYFELGADDDDTF